MRPATRYIHACQEPDPATGAVTVPVSLAVTFRQDGVGKPHGGWEYGRTANPSRSSLEGAIAAAENGRYGLCFASGSAATAAVLGLLDPGDEVLSTIDVYGGTSRLLRKVYSRYGVTARFLAEHSPDAFRGAITDRTRMIWVETPTNPMLNIIDLAALASLKGSRVLFVVDNTFASPHFQNPLDLGADIVVHSTTKYVAGHSDAVGGAVVTQNAEIHGRLQFHQNAAGAVPSPFDCYPTQRGLKTLAVRMDRHQANAFALTDALAAHPALKALHYPGSPLHPGHETAARQMRGYSGMVTLELAGGIQAVERFVAALQVFTFAESLGGVESLACHPATMTHASLPEEERNRIGITEGLIRLSVGIEDAADLCEDVLQALSRV